jgi:signal transduction histidine kinase
MLSRPGERPRQRLDLRAPITEALEFLRPSFDEKRVALEATLDARPAFVLGDHSELEALFINLLLNAQEATPPAGTVRVTVAVTDDAVTASVADTGPGIPAEQADRIFEPFFTTKPQGSGLGLTICAGIAAGHRAKLRAVNDPGGGALFTVEFIPAPLAADAVPNEVATQP